MGREGGREGARAQESPPQSPPKVDGLCFTNKNAKINPQRPNTWDKEGGVGRGGRVRVWGGGRSSGQAGNVSLRRRPSWLGAGLIGFAFKHHD